MRVTGWEKWQSYRKDRGQPPWIKVHRRLLRNLDFLRLPDLTRGHLIHIWILAADHDGEIPDDPEDVRMLCHLRETPDIELLLSAGFLERDAKATPKRRQSDANLRHSCGTYDAPEAEAEENRGETDLKREANASLSAAGADPMKTVVPEATTEIHISSASQNLQECAALAPGSANGTKVASSIDRGNKNGSQAILEGCEPRASTEPTSRDALAIARATISAEWKQLVEQHGVHEFASWTEKRMASLRERWTDKFWREHYVEAIRKIGLSSWHKGCNDRNWRANIDWFLRPNSVARLMEKRFERPLGTCEREDDNRDLF